MTGGCFPRRRDVEGRWFPRRILLAVRGLPLLASMSVSPTVATDLARGQYLIEALTACDNCHTPRAHGDYATTSRFSGGAQVFSGKGYSVRGSNITPDEEHGVGAWTDAQLRAAIVDGVGPEGRLAPVMPSESYRVLTQSDLDALITVLRAATPVAAKSPAPQIRGGQERRRPLPGAEAAFTEGDLADKTKRGLYVASLARCMGCHSGEIDDAPDHANRLGAGGKIFRTPAGTAVASNITSHQEKGVGAWSDDELKRAITKGLGRDGKALAPTMANLSKLHFSKMSADDLDALVAWLRTVPPRD